MRIKMIGLAAILFAGFSSNASADQYYRHRHCGYCRPVTTDRWEKRSETNYRRVLVGYRTRVVRWDRQSAGLQRYISHYETKWVKVHEEGRGYLYRIWKKQQVPVYASRPIYKNVPITVREPVYQVRPHTSSRWVRVSQTYWACPR